MRMMSSSMQQGSSNSVVVVGGGAAGYMAAIQCGSKLQKESSDGDGPFSVTVLEMSSSPLQKVKISGGGRCNVLHDPSKGAKLIAQGYPRGDKELISPYTKTWGPREAYSWFNERVALKTEADGRVFPTTDKSESIVQVLQAAARDVGVNIQCSTNVRGVQVLPSGSFKIEYTQRVGSSDGGKRGDVHECFADHIVIATGSSKAGHKMIADLGHTIVPPKPSLFSFKIKDDRLTDLSGLSVPNARVKMCISKTFKRENKDLVRPNQMSKFEQEGPLLITHQGLSGPAVLRLSAYAARVMAELTYDFEIVVAWIPEVSTTEVMEHLEETKSSHPQRSVTKTFPKLDLVRPEELEWTMDEGERPSFQRGSIPKRLWGYILSKAGVDVSAGLVYGQLKRETLMKIATELTEGRFRVQGRGQYRDEFVTAGGVDTAELHFDKMESKRVPQMYFAGEILNIDGITG